MTPAEMLPHLQRWANAMQAADKMEAELLAPLGLQPARPGDLPHVSPPARAGAADFLRCGTVGVRC